MNSITELAVAHSNSYGVYQEELKSLQKNYADLWGPLSDLLRKLSEVVRLLQKGAALRRSFWIVFLFVKTRIY